MNCRDLTVLIRVIATVVLVICAGAGLRWAGFGAAEWIWVSDQKNFDRRSLVPFIAKDFAGALVWLVAGAGCILALRYSRVLVRSIIGKARG